MRLLLRNCKFRPLCYGLVRKCSGAARAETTQYDTRKLVGDPNLVEVAPSWSVDEEPEMRRAVVQDMQVVPDFVSEQEEAALLAELEPYLKRMRYEFDHWDNAIQGYRETERSSWRAENRGVLERVRALAFLPGEQPLPHAHVLDLAPAGSIAPHVDAVRFCGAVIAGISLCSSAVMRLQHARGGRERLALHALLPRRSLYVMRGVARYCFTHAVPAGACAWPPGAAGAGAGAGAGAAGAGGAGGEVRRARRVAIICRSRPAPAPAPPAPAPAPQP